MEELILKFLGTLVIALSYIFLLKFIGFEKIVIIMLSYLIVCLIYNEEEIK